MTPFELLKPDHTPSGVWVCDNCRITAADERRASLCCTPIPCRYCGKPTDQIYRRDREPASHRECERAQFARDKMMRIEKAEKLETWDGWVWDGNRYFESLDDYVDYLECEGLAPEDWPEWVHVTSVSHPTINVDHVLQNVCEYGWEDMDEDSLKGVADLRAAVAAFNQANAGLDICNGDYMRVVRVPRVEAATE